MKFDYQDQFEENLMPEIERLFATAGAWWLHVEAMATTPDNPITFHTRDGVEVGAYTPTMGKARTAGENARAMNAQRKKGRDPIYFTDQERKDLIQEVLSAFREAIESGENLDVAVERGLNAASDKYIKKITEHVDKTTTKDGQMKPVSEKWKQIKIKIHKKYMPTLVNTGQLRKCFKRRIEKEK